MNSWVDLPAVLNIVGFGLLLGAGVPAVYALGIKALAWTPPPDRGPTRRWPHRLLAVLCLSTAVLTVAAGLTYLTTQS